jgi:hypothetical protein
VVAAVVMAVAELLLLLAVPVVMSVAVLLLLLAVAAVVFVFFLCFYKLEELIRLPALEMEQSPFLPPPTVELVALSLFALLSRMLLLGLSSHPHLSWQLILLFLVGFLPLVLLQHDLGLRLCRFLCGSPFLSPWIGVSHAWSAVAVPEGCWRSSRIESVGAMEAGSLAAEEGMRDGVADELMTPLLVCLRRPRSAGLPPVCPRCCCLSVATWPQGPYPGRLALGRCLAAEPVGSGSPLSKTPLTFSAPLGR